MSCTTAKWIRSVDRLFVSGLSARRFRRLRGHLATCERCRAYYDRVAIVWRAMGKEATPPQVAEALAEDLIRGVVPGGAARRVWPRLLAAAAGLAGLLVVARLAGLPERLASSDDPAWRERGAPAARARGVRAFCLGVDAARETVVRGAAPSARGAEPMALRCAIEDSLQFAYTLGDGPPEHLVLVGRDGEGRLTWYSPVAGGAPLALRPGSADEPLPASVRLRVNHRPGRVTVVALFAARPLSADEVRQALERGAALEALPGVQDRQTLLLDLE